MNKHFLNGLILGIMMTFILSSILVFSEDLKDTIEVVFNSVNLEVNGEKIKIDNILYDGTTYIPIRKVAKMVGKEVKWDSKTRTVSINESKNDDKVENSKVVSSKINKTEEDPNEIKFNEKGLENIVRKMINKPSGKIYAGDVKEITKIVFPNPENEEDVISDIEPLKHFTGLKEIELNNHKISDITPLKDLKNLEKLSLNSNNIKDIASLKNLIKLQELHLSRNKIENISDLERLKELKVLALNGNKIIDLKGIENLNGLQKLFLSENAIKDISNLEKLINLQVLYLYHNKLTDITPVGNLKKLRNLSLNNNDISDIKVLGELTNLEKLVIKNNKISSISILSDLKDLKILYLRGNNIKDLSPANEIFSQLIDKDFELKTSEN